MADFTGKLTDLPLSGQVVPRTTRDLGALITLTAAGAGTTNSADQENPSSRGVAVVVDITAKTGTIDLVVTIQKKDRASGKYIDVLASVSLTAVGTTVYLVHPDLTAANNTIAKDILFEVWRVKVVSGTGSSPVITATIGACILS
jgi:hypothetical protein